MTGGVRSDIRTRKPIGIIGASSVVAEYLTQLLAAQYQPLLFSRSIPQSQMKPLPRPRYLFGSASRPSGPHPIISTYFWSEGLAV
jgi:hypothetical protein